jgi:hypothetical protein
LRLEELLPAAAGAVQDHDRIIDFTTRVAAWLAERGVVDAQCGHALTISETKVADREISFADRPFRCRGSGCRRRRRLRGQGRRLKGETGKCRKKQDHSLLLTCFCGESKRAVPAYFKALRVVAVPRLLRRNEMMFH